MANKKKKSGRRWGWFLGGMGLGAGVAYLLSKQDGKPQIVDRLNEALNKANDRLKDKSSGEAKKPEEKSLQLLSELSGQPKKSSNTQPDLTDPKLEQQGGWHDPIGVQLNRGLEEQRDQATVSQPEERRESGLPGGGPGRRDEVGGSGIYPVSSGQMPPGDELIRTPGEFGQRGRGLEGYYDHGEAGFTQAEVQIYGAQTTPVDQNRTPIDQKKPENKSSSKELDSETAASGMVDVDQDNINPASL